MVRLTMTSAAEAKKQQLRTRGNGVSSSRIISWLPSLSIFIVGFVIGHFRGSSYSSCSGSGGGYDSYHAAKANACDPRCPSSVKDSPGWNSVDVYYGKTDHVQSLLKPSTKRWFSEGRQDEVVLALLQHAKDNGHLRKTDSAPIFIDLAASDATSMSNTYALERFHGWKGYCIEPNPMYWYNLTHYRPDCTIIGAVLGSDSDLVSFVYAAGEHGGIADDGIDNGINKKWKRHASKEYSVSLEKVFERYDVPTTIDYLSLDVEGAEELVFQNFPFDQYHFRVLTIEKVDQKPQLKAKLLDHGYTNLIRLTKYGATLWAHSSVIQGMTQAELDSILDEFDSKKQRLARNEAKATAAAKAAAAKAEAAKAAVTVIVNEGV